MVTRRNRTAIAVVAVALVVPFSPAIGPGGSLWGLSARASESSAFVLPASVLVVAFVFAWRILRQGKLGLAWPLGLGEGALAVYVIVNSLALLLGGLAHGIEAAQVGYLGQSLAPVVAYLVGQGLVRRSNDRSDAVAHFTRAVAITGVVIGAGLALATLALGTVPGTGIVDSLGPVELTKVKRFIPTVVAACVSLQLLRHRRRFRSIDAVPLGLAALAVLLAHSRFAAGGLVVVVFVSLVAGGTILRRRHIGASLAGLGSIALFILGLQLFGANVPLVGDVDLRAYERLVRPGDSEQLSTENRVEAAVGGLGEGLTSPFGRAFSLEIGESTGGYELGRERIANSENGFTEVALRSGPIGLAALLVWLGAECRGRLAAARRNRNDLAINVVLLVFFFGGAWVQTSFTELYSATLFFALLGVSSPRLRKAVKRPEIGARSDSVDLGGGLPAPREFAGINRGDQLGR